MLEILLQIDLNKMNTKILVNDLYAGILYKDSKPLKPMLFEKKDNQAINVFNQEKYPIEEGKYYVSSLVLLQNPTKHFLNKYYLNMWDLIMVYKMFINDEKFINNNLHYFGLKEVEVGYKGKKEIIELMHGYFHEDAEIYYKLIKVINYKNELEREKNNGTKTK